MGATAWSVCCSNVYDFSETRKTYPVKRDSEFLVAGDLNQIGMGNEKNRAVRRTVESSPTTHAGTEGLRIRMRMLPFVCRLGPFQVA